MPDSVGIALPKYQTVTLSTFLTATFFLTVLAIGFLELNLQFIQNAHVQDQTVIPVLFFISNQKS